MIIFRSLTNFVVKSKRKARATRGSVDFLFGLTTPEGPVGMPMADALGKITKFVKESYFFTPGTCRHRLAAHCFTATE
jgi:hypothetical protein